MATPVFGPPGGGSQGFRHIIALKHNGRKASPPARGRRSLHAPDDKAHAQPPQRAPPQPLRPWRIDVEAAAPAPPSPSRATTRLVPTPPTPPSVVAPARSPRQSMFRRKLFSRPANSQRPSPAGTPRNGDARFLEVQGGRRTVSVCSMVTVAEPEPEHAEPIKGKWYTLAEDVCINVGDTEALLQELAVVGLPYLTAEMVETAVARVCEAHETPRGAMLTAELFNAVVQQLLVEVPMALAAQEPPLGDAPPATTDINATFNKFAGSRGRIAMATMATMSQVFGMTPAITTDRELDLRGFQSFFTEQRSAEDMFMDSGGMWHRKRDDRLVAIRSLREALGPLPGAGVVLDFALLLLGEILTYKQFCLMVHGPLVYLSEDPPRAAWVQTCVDAVHQLRSLVEDEHNEYLSATFKKLRPTDDVQTIAADTAKYLLFRYQHGHGRRARPRHTTLGEDPTPVAELKRLVLLKALGALADGGEPCATPPTPYNVHRDDANRADWVRQRRLRLALDVLETSTIKSAKDLYRHFALVDELDSSPGTPAEVAGHPRASPRSSPRQCGSIPGSPRRIKSRGSMRASMKASLNSRVGSAVRGASALPSPASTSTSPRTMLDFVRTRSLAAMARIQAGELPIPKITIAKEDSATEDEDDDSVCISPMSPEGQFGDVAAALYMARQTARNRLAVEVSATGRPDNEDGRSIAGATGDALSSPRAARRDAEAAPAASRAAAQDVLGDANMSPFWPSAAEESLAEVDQEAADSPRGVRCAKGSLLYALRERRRSSWSQASAPAATPPARARAMFLSNAPAHFASEAAGGTASIFVPDRPKVPEEEGREDEGLRLTLPGPPSAPAAGHVDRDLYCLTPTDDGPTDDGGDCVQVGDVIDRAVQQDLADVCGDELSSIDSDTDSTPASIVPVLSSRAASCGSTPWWRTEGRQLDLGSSAEIRHRRKVTCQPGSRASLQTASPARSYRTSCAPLPAPAHATGVNSGQKKRAAGPRREKTDAVRQRRREAWLRELRKHCMPDVAETLRNSRKGPHSAAPRKQRYKHLMTNHQRTRLECMDKLQNGYVSPAASALLGVGPGGGGIGSLVARLAEMRQQAAIDAQQHSQSM